MATSANILVKDDAATPKEWTLTPVTGSPANLWRANDVAIPLEGEPRLWCTTEQLKSGDYKVTAKLELPVMETLGASGTSAGYVAPPKVAYTEVAIFTMFHNRRSTVADRANTLRMMVGFLQGAGVTTGTGSMDNTDAGGTFTGATTANPGPLAFIYLTLPT